MRRDDRPAGRCPRTIAALAALLASLVLADRGLAVGLVGANYALNWDQTVDRTDVATTKTWTFKHSLDVKYKGFLSPIVENEITMKIEQQIKSEGEPRETIRINPVIILGYKGSYWSAGAKRTIDDSNEPGKNAKISDSYFVELLYRPARGTLPDLKAKYTLDTDFQAESTDMLKHALSMSSIDRPQRWLELKGEYSRNWTKDRLKPDADTFDDKYSGAIGIRHVVSPKIRVNSEAKVENATGGTLLSAGGTTSDKHEQTYDWKNTLAFLPFKGTTVDGSYDWQEKQNLETREHTYQKNYKAAVSQAITPHLTVTADFTRSVAESRHTADDNRKTDDTYTVDVKPNLNQLFAFTLKWQKKDTKEVHFTDPTRNTTSGTVAVSASWSALVMPFWRASASYDKTDTITKEVTTAIDTKYSLKSTFEFKPLRVTLDPTYDIALKEDRTVRPTAETATRDFKFKIAWNAVSTRNIDVKADHTYGRKEDTGLKNIQRTDTSNVNILWAKPFPNWSFGIDMTRSATDTSEDDLPPDITASFNFRADYVYERLTMGTAYKYDRKKLSDDSETIDLKFGWLAAAWDVTVTYSFNKTFSETLKEGYTLGIAFKYNL